MHVPFVTRHVVQAAFACSVPLPLRQVPAAHDGKRGAIGHATEVALMPLGAGTPLPLQLRHELEAKFKTDFSSVRVHIGPQASQIGALALTCGENICFAPGQYRPTAPEGRRLLAHELAHVVQQRSKRVHNPFPSASALVQDPSLEAEAEYWGRIVGPVPRPQAKPTRTAAVQRARTPRLRTSVSGVRTGDSRPFQSSGVVQAHLEIASTVEGPFVQVANFNHLLMQPGQVLRETTTGTYYLLLHRDGSRLFMQSEEDGGEYEYNLAQGAHAVGGTVIAMGHVRRNDTPAGMPDRITLNRTFSYFIDVRNQLPMAANLSVRIAGCNQQNGQVVIMGGGDLLHLGLNEVFLGGTTQTARGRGLRLRVQVLAGNDVVLQQSHPFCVAAVPHSWRVTGHQRVEEEGAIGIDIQDEWSSDSGDLAHLDEVEISEVLQNVQQTGCFAGLGIRDSGYLTAAEVSIDTHALVRENVTGPGEWVVHQGHIFRDGRSGANNIVMPGSGYEIRHRVIAIGHNRLKVSVQKVGATVTVNGRVFSAGAGDQSDTEEIET